MSQITLENVRAGDTIQQDYSVAGVQYCVKFKVSGVMDGMVLTEGGAQIDGTIGTLTLLDRPKPSLDVIQPGRRISVDTLRGETRSEPGQNWILMRTESLEPSRAWLSSKETEGRYWFHSHIDIGNNWVSLDQIVEVQEP